jgi:hypothetical protein
METVSLIDCDPKLAVGLSEADRAAASKVLQAPLLRLEPGSAWPPQRPDTAYLVVEGMLIRRVHLGKGRSAELLVKDDVLMPAVEEAVSFAAAVWEVLDAARLAAINLEPRSQIWRWPSICRALLLRPVERTRMLATQAAIMSIVGVEQRLHALLWALAERWGHVGEQGVELTLKVHQQVLAEMVGARRPTVSIALGSLSDQGLLSSPAAGRWILEGEPPEIERTG